MKNKNKPLRIGIDARFYGPLGKGLGRYTQEVVDNILKMDKECDFVVFLSKDNYQDFHTTNPRVKKVLAAVRWYTLAEQLVMPRLIAKEKLDLIHYPHFNVPIFSRTPFVVTIHDLILFRYPTLRATTLSPLVYKLKNFAYKLAISHAVHQSKKIITVSAFTKKDILDQFKINADKIVVTHEGVASFRKSTAVVSADKVLTRYQLSGDFLLYVGNAYPHKNLDKLIDVFHKFHQTHPAIKLVLVGKEDYFYKKLKTQAAELGLWFGEASVKNQVIFPGYVPDNDLEIFYRSALAYVFPSLYEGFGLPPLEAMAHDCPVVSSNRSSMPEILGLAALYFDPTSASGFLSALEKITSDEVLRQELITAGRDRVKMFDWPTCAEATLQVYLAACSN